ncbi:MAG: tRNA lysidine(34) synthetase TilS [Egibacteraceae bacterium]
MTRTAGRGGSPPPRDPPAAVRGPWGETVLIGALRPGQGRDAVLAEVRAVLDAVVAPRAPVVLAVSGGPDSTALAFLVTEARPDLVACVAHIRHGLRDDAADAEVAAAHAAALGLAYHQRSVQVRSTGRGVEAAAREARYAALSRIAAAVQARALVVGHTADDQAETVLLNIARGTGLRGLGGMAVSRPSEHDTEGAHGVRVVRPLLRLRRDDVHAFVTGEGLRAVMDPTNRDPRQRRARVRHDLLPAVAALSGGTGDPVGALTRLADLAREDADTLDELAADMARRSVVAWGPARAVPTADLATLPRGLATRVVRLLLRGVHTGVEGPASSGSAPASSVEAILALGPGAALHAPGGVWVTRGGGWLAAVPPGLPALPARPLRVPGQVVLPELGLAVRSDLVPWRDEPGLARATNRDRTTPTPLAVGPPGTARAPWAVVPADAALVVRSRRSGDRIGSARLTDALSDAGVPRALRDLVPVVAGSGDLVVWVPGLDVPHPAAASSRGREAVRLWLAAAR